MSDISDCIIKILADNGVSVEQIDIWKDNGLVRNVKNIIELDFSEHDKAFADEIETLKEKLLNTTKIAEQNRRESFVLKIKNQDLKNITKGYEDKIAELENIINHKLGDWDKHGITYQEILDMKTENQELKQRIAELESKETETFEKEPISGDCRPSMEWYENRHQSDCIEINRLNTTIDVLIHKVEYLRQFAGLE